MNKSAYAEMIKRRPFGWLFDDPPAIESFEFERIDPYYWHKFFDDNWKLSYYVGAVYIMTIFGIRELMKTRPAFELKTPLFLWNSILGIFSFIGFTRTAPDLLNAIIQQGFYNSICLKQGISVPSIYWGLLFALSKMLELGDTVFIVLRKRPLVFLQWYHHLVTLWVVWSVAPLVEPIGRWYGVLNYGVHSLMYPYFALKTIGIRVPTRITTVITTLQLTQMIVGFAVNMTSLYFQQSGYDCVRYPISIKAFNLVYGSFILLFGKLFYDSVVVSGRKKMEKLQKQS